MEKEDIKKLQDTVDIVAKTTLHILEVMATKEDLLKLQLQANNIESELKSFKKDTQNNFKELNEKFDDQHDTVMSYDGRIEKLENKVFA